MQMTLILAMMKILMAVVTAVMMLKTAQTREIMMKSNLTPLDLKAHEINEHHAGADGSLAQLIKIKKEARKYVRMSKEKIYLLVRLRCAALFEIALFCTFIM